MSDFYLFRNTVRDLARPGKLAAALLLVGLFLLIAVLARTNARAGDFHPIGIFDSISARLVFGFMLIILSVVFATGVIVQEVEQKTIPYLLTRPIPRWRILFAKYAAVVLVTSSTLCIADLLVALALFGPGKLGQSRLWQDCLILPVGALAYGGLFLLLATIFERPLIFGLAYAFGWESWAPYLPGDWSKVSLMSYLHALAPHLDSVNATSADSVLAPVNIPAWLAWCVLSCVIAASLLAAHIIFSIREYTPREERT
jgi:ABC-2 type transport system permease protein